MRWTGFLSSPLVPVRRHNALPHWHSFRLDHFDNLRHSEILVVRLGRSG